jgi:hypothetical protein
LLLKALKALCDTSVYRHNRYRISQMEIPALCRKKKSCGALHTGELRNLCYGIKPKCHLNTKDTASHRFLGRLVRSSHPGDEELKAALFGEEISESIIIIIIAIIIITRKLTHDGRNRLSD